MLFATSVKIAEVKFYEDNQNRLIV